MGAALPAGRRIASPGKIGYGRAPFVIPYEFRGTVDLVLAPEGMRCRVEQNRKIR
jgi:hypothetical protein